jgi:hypothetical protein
MAALHAFATTQVVAHDLRSIRDLPVDEMRVYARAACVSGADFGSVKDALGKQLRGIPVEMLKELVDRALTKGVSTTSSAQTTVNSPSEEGKAVSYIGFWATRYDAGAGPVGPMYSTCVTASGMDIRVAEEVAEWQTTQENVVVGVDPCHCTAFNLYCRDCERTETRTMRKPVFKRHRLTLQDQMELHKWMVKKAVDHALAIEPAKAAWWLNGLWAKRGSAIAASGWQGPFVHSFVGDDLTDRVVVSDNEDL